MLWEIYMVDQRKLRRLIEENQSEGGLFRSYYSTHPSGNLEIKPEGNIESPFIHSLILEQLYGFDEPLIQKRAELAKKALLNLGEKYEGFQVWRFVPPFNDFQYPPDFDDTAVAVRALVISNRDSSGELKRNYSNLAKYYGVWVSEGETILPTFMNRGGGNSIDFVVNVNALQTLALCRDTKNEHLLAKTLERFVNSDLFDKPIEDVSRYYLYRSSFSYPFSTIQKVKGYFDGETIDRVKEKAHILKPKNSLEASLNLLSLRNLGETPSREQLQHLEDSDKMHALFRRRRGNLYFGSPLLDYLFMLKAKSLEQVV